MRTWISRRLRPLLAASAVVGLSWAGWSQREAIASFDWSIDRGLLALAVALFAIAPLLQGLTFALGLRRVGADGPAGPLARMWARSFLLRYEPSGVVGFAYRVTARERVGASTAQVVTATGYEQLAVVAGLDAFLLVGAFALSWLLGVLVPLAPGGLGLREGSLILSLGAAMGAGPATALALALRLVSFAGELVAIAAAELAALALGRRATKVLPAIAAPAPVPAGDREGTIVVVPTYCEADALPRFVERFAATGLELLVVDDASPDGTGELAHALAAERPWMHALHRAGKDGLGMAYRAGFSWCLERGYRVIGQMDSDLSHPPEKLAEMLAVLDAREADLVLGNRYMPGGGTAGWSAARRVLSRMGCTGSKLVLGLPFDDLSGGFKLWRASTLAALDFDSMLATGYAFQVETTQLAYLMGKRIEEVPFVFSERIAGESKMTLAVSLEGIRVALALRRRARNRRGSNLVVT